MRTVVVVLAIATTVGVGAGAGAGAAGAVETPSDDPPLVMLGPVVDATPDHSAVCGDTVVPGTEGTFEIRRDPASGDALDVRFALGGDADPAFYSADPGDGRLTIPPGAPSAVVKVHARDRTAPGPMMLTLTIEPDAAYTVDGPVTASMEIPPTRTEDPDCGTLAFTDAPTNRYQTIAVGETPIAIEYTLATRMVETEYRVDAGALPDGVVLTDRGAFSGAATRAGTFTSTLAVCQGPCVTTELTIVVVDERASARTLPATGSARSDALLAGLGSLAVGGALVVAGRRRVA